MDEHSEVRGDDEPGEQAEARAAEHHAEAGRERRAADRGERGPEPGRQRRDAGGAEGHGQEPVEQRRRLEVRHAVDPRRDRVAVERHLERHLGVEALRRIQERGGAQPDEVEADRDEGDAERDAAHRSS